MRGQGIERDVYEICRQRDRDKDNHWQRDRIKNRETQIEYIGSRNPRYTDERTEREKKIYVICRQRERERQGQTQTETE